MDLAYLITPFAAWLTAGSLKFAINSLKAGRPAFGLIGYGGLPSNHSAIVSSMAALIALREGIGHPAFGVALTLAFIVLLDANSLRRQVGLHAEAINRLGKSEPEGKVLRERMGHSKVEIIAGLVVGAAVAFLVQGLF
ncbi:MULTISPECIES: divergent PAP2 family protein [Pseudomonas]|uniref:divergent PAP2 family protein n=1 Tax=Pseudomonas TaxID=286 RepID=UPI001C7FFB47|nr:MULTISPECIES: divergent PAP2 family protein [Pseudomonas]MDG9929189.1 divergent PAP2 family protein [Pseudomonas sp. GD04042]MDH0484029.1 divergent PAP2 family protein [Pseudomonas sp. GD04015]MDH0605837.1 divergent PAP2 family protein [Pseudomonas sp. GD03869]